MVHKWLQNFRTIIAFLGSKKPLLKMRSNGLIENLRGFLTTIHAEIKNKEIGIGLILDLLERISQLEKERHFYRNRRQP
jgi:hypothetical protein